MLLWVTILVGPVLMLAQQQLQFMLVPWACATGLRPYLWIVTAVSILIVLGAAANARRMWQQTGADWPSEEGGAMPRTRFMAAGALLLNLMFAFAILAQGIPTFILNPCN